jgi:hypothetical protein
MEIAIGIAVLAIAGIITASVAAVRVTARDGYRQAPCRNA